MRPEQEQVIASTRQWLSDTVIGLNLCPFAKRVMLDERIRFVVSEGESEETLLASLEDEFRFLELNPDAETTLLIVTDVLQDFREFNQFLDYADALLKQTDREGVFQIAHFHPDYQFAGTQPGDAENYTNRSPYPVLHLLREASLDRVLKTTEHAEQIPVRNIELMNTLGTEEMQRRLDRCLSHDEEQAGN